MPAKSDRTYHHGDLRQALIVAAQTIVAEQQTWDFSLREVARLAGVSHNAPYRHFPDKLDMLAAVAAEGFEDLRKAMENAYDEAEQPDRALVAIGAAYAAFGGENPARYRLMFSTVLGASRDALPPLTAQAAAGSKAVLERVIAKGVAERLFSTPEESGDPAGLLTLVAWSTMHGLTMLSIDGLVPSDVSAALSREVGTVILEGMRRRQS